MTRLLVTGFEPFGSVFHNPSAAIIDRLPPRIAGAPITTCVLPVETDGVTPILETLFEQPFAAVLHLGVAEDRQNITVERRAQNVRDFLIPDNRGVTVRGPVIEGAPEEIPSRLPVVPIIEALLHAGIDAGASDSAGTYLCNQVMFTSLFRLPAAIPAGFIHLPPDEQLRPSGGFVSIEAQTRAIEIALEVIVQRCLPQLSV